MPNRYNDDAMDRLIQCAKAEFLKQGYQNASLRTIAANAEVSTYTIYLRFKDKAELFSAVVRPAAEMFADAFYREMELFNRTCPTAPYDEMTQYMMKRFYVLVDVIYADYDTFYLLATNTENPEYEAFIHKLGDIQANQTLLYMSAIGEVSASVSISPELLHLTYTAHFSGMLEVVRHGMNKAQALEYFAQLQLFFFAGYKALMQPDF